jgi:hypothetical protein
MIGQDYRLIEDWASCTTVLLEGPLKPATYHLGEARFCYNV